MKVIFPRWHASPDFACPVALVLDTPCLYPWRIDKEPALQPAVPSLCPWLGRWESSDPEWTGEGCLAGRCGPPGTPRSCQQCRQNERPKASTQRDHGKTLSTVVYKSERETPSDFLEGRQSLEGKLGKLCACLGHRGSNPHGINLSLTWLSLVLSSWPPVFQHRCSHRER